MAGRHRYELAWAARRETEVTSTKRFDGESSEPVVGETATVIAPTTGVRVPAAV